MKIKILSGILIWCVAMMSLAWSPQPMAAAVANSPVASHNHEEQTWYQWDGKTSLDPGKYYLANDITYEKGVEKTIFVNGDVTLCLNGHVLDVNNSKIQFIVNSEASLTLCDCAPNTVIEGYTDQNGLWHHGQSTNPGDQSMNLNGGVITGCHSLNPLILTHGECHFTSGTLAGNSVPEIIKMTVIGNVNKSKVYLSGGNIVANHAQALQISNWCEAVMSGGAITGNVKNVDGAGINLAGKFIMTGGDISGNRSDSGYGGGIFINSNGVVSLEGGRIAQNTAANCGGICIWQNGKLQLSGDVVIRDNAAPKNGNNIYLYGGAIDLTAPLTGAERIGIYLKDGAKAAFTTGWKTHMSGKSPADYFFSENEGCTIGTNQSGEATFIQHQHGGNALALWNEGASLPTTDAYALMTDVALQSEAVLQANDTLTLCLNGHRVSYENGVALRVEKGAKLYLNDCPGQSLGTMSGKEAAILLDTNAATTLQDASVQVGSYKGAPVKVQEAHPADAVGGCAIVGPANAFELVNPGYHYEYRDGGYYVAVDTYKIAYKNADGSDFVGLPQDAPIVHTYGNETTLPQPSKAGYRFDGWYENADGSGQPLTVIAADTTKDITLYGKWIPVVEAPIISAQPEDVTITQGETAALSVQAKAAFDGDTLRYQWYETATAEDNLNGQALSGATQATFEIPREQKAGTGYYYCVVTAEREGVSRSVPSKVAKVTVQAPVAPPQPPVILPGETVTHPDGSVTTTVTKPNGDKVATTTYPNGDRVALTTTPDGTIKVAIQGTSPRLVKIPVEGLNAGNVAMVTDMQGKAALEQCCVPTKEGLALMVSDGDRVEICQKSPFFVDVAADYWAVDNITFAAARGLVVGVDATHFAPEGETTRAMIWSILSRMEGISASGGDNWYVPGQKWAMANGVSDGTQPMAAITREQLAAMLYRYAGAPTVEGDIAAFKDADAVSDWAKQAMSWAVNEGLIAGMSADTLAPQGTATRAQTAAILQRLIAWQLGV